MDREGANAISGSEDHDSPTLRAQSIFAEWLIHREDGEAQTFQRLLEDHPGLCARLQRMRSGLERVDGEALEDEARASDPEAARAWRHPPTRALLGSLLGNPTGDERYEFVKLLGSGGMGVVEQVFEPTLRRFLARKVIRTEERGGLVPDQGVGYERALARFFEEAQVTAQLTHPGVVPVHELGVDARGDVYFTMDRVGGMDLSRAFEMQRQGVDAWSLARLVGVLQRVCETMAFAHARGVVHRDLKPANVMVGDFGEVYVMDWGLARVLGAEASPVETGLDSTSEFATPLVESPRREGSASGSPFLTQEGSAAGTPAFMPPEQAKGQLDLLDARTDVYALGAMLYTLLAGHKPYADLTEGGAFEVLLLVSQRPPTPLSRCAPDAPPELVAICEQGMQRERDARYPDMHAMAEDLRAWLEGRVVSAHEHGAWAEARKWMRRNKGLSAALAAGLLAIFGGVSGMAVVEARGRSALLTERDVTKLTRGPQQMRLLLEDTRTLWPAVPEREPEFTWWLHQADELLQSWPFYEQGLVALREGPQGTLFEGATLEGGLEPSLAEMLEQRQVLTKWRTRITARLGFARTLEEHTLTGDEARSRWALAIEGVARNETYGGMALEPQLGLLPLRADPVSGLWEFWAVATGTEPELDPASDRWKLEPETGVVLVLVPGGEATIGSLPPAEDGSNLGEPFVDNFACHEAEDENPLRSAPLDAFFIAKYELTGGQWSRALEEISREPALDAYPRVNVTHVQCSEVVRHLGLFLPTEAQWEYACRAGTNSSYSMPGSAEFDFHRGLSTRDEAYSRVLEWCGEFANFGQFDGRLIQSGALEPNPWGLHDVHGNAWEWVADSFSWPSEAPLGNGDGATEPRAGARLGILRGGGFGRGDWSFCEVRSSNRMAYDFDNFDGDLGLRVARQLDE